MSGQDREQSKLKGICQIFFFKFCLGKTVKLSLFFVSLWHPLKYTESSHHKVKIKSFITVMVIVVNCTYCGDHFTIYKNMKSLLYTYKNIVLY